MRLTLSVRCPASCHPTQRHNPRIALCPAPRDRVCSSRNCSLEEPLWLYAAAVDDEVRSENVPQADQEALEQLLVDAARRDVLLMSLGRTLDAEQLAHQGARGEEFVVRRHHRASATDRGQDNQQRLDRARRVLPLL
jgi:hypothetical protein